MPVPRSCLKRNRQSGGITVVLALVLLSILATIAFGMARSSIRELATTGTVTQGGKADKAAEAGLDWFITWSGTDSVAANASATTAAGMLADAMNAIKSRNAGYAFRDSSKVSWVGDPSNLAVRVSSLENQMATSGMVFDNTDTTRVTQNTGTGNSVAQRFDLTIRYLGSVRQALNSVSAGASGGTDVATRAPEDLVFAVSSTGYASVDLGSGSYMRYQQQCEMVGQQNTSQ